MITVYDIEVSKEFKTLHILLLIFELILIIPGVFLVISFGYVMFFRSPQFHAHIHIIIAFIYIAYFIVTISRLILIIVYFAESKMTFEVTVSDFRTVLFDAIRSAAASSILLLIPAMTLERCLATIRLKTYEKERHYVFLFFCLILFSFCCGLNAFLIVSGVPLFAFICFGLSWLLFNLLAFSRLVKWCQKEYDLQMKLSVAPLTVRFQLSENVRVGKILLATLRVLCIGVGLALILVLLVILITRPYNIHWATLLIYHIFEMEIAFAAVLVALTIINSDKKWSSEFSKLLLRLTPCRKKRIEEVKQTSVFSLAGSQLVFTQEVEGTTYFDNLRSQWQ